MSIGAEVANGSTNGNGKLWKVAALIAIPVYGLVGWALLSTSDNKSMIAQHEEKFASAKAEVLAVKVDFAKDVATMQRDFLSLRSDMLLSQQQTLNNQSKIEIAIQSGQAEMRSKIDLMTEKINSINVLVGGHVKK